MKKIIILSTIIIANLAFSQIAIGKTGISTLADNVTPNPSISLEFGAGNKGIILPWVTSAGGVTSAVPGTIIFDTTDYKIKVKLASSWKDLTINTSGAADTVLQNNLTDQNSAKTAIGTNSATDTTPGILVLTDTDKAMVLPKMASPHLNIKNPAPGMMAYDTSAKQLAVFNGTVWSFWK
ncbi:hypothetical protein [Chryseobacterium taihuense]|uniref:Uncharacterized protein n=1 Tax=Chryseobacterium taihuense TaxID=1141221 RepID=A0ABY0QX29_9FLAO|nr:hypothetical protein [Chryseobacterium taihuense]SDM06805.1 hypothetical protein SAMN05216273_11216 [Chryseobacterium taihuense]